MSDLHRLIIDKWYLSLETLAQRSGACLKSIKKVVHGYGINKKDEIKLREFLENYEGEEG